jgi:hypothetical protein
MGYAKEIGQCSTGMVIATVYDLTTGKTVGLKFFFSGLLSSQEKRLRAHTWADKWIRNCEMYCVEKPLILREEDRC